MKKHKILIVSILFMFSLIPVSAKENNNICEVGTNLADCIKSLYTVDGENNLYFHDGVGSYQNSNLEAEDYSYRYSGGDYKVADAYATTYKKINEIIKTKRVGQYDRYYLVYDKEEKYYDHPRKVLEQAIIDGYVEKAGVNNYICFGSIEKNCSPDNLYRIIGVFSNNVKLIKAYYATEDQLGTNGDFYATFTSKEELNNHYVSKFNDIADLTIKFMGEKITYYYWNHTNKDLAVSETGYGNLWNYSELNKTNLNKNFLNYLGEEWSSKIAATKWYIGGIDKDIGEKANAKTLYQHELGANKNTLPPFEPYQAKVGLMYVSEYHYSALPGYWNVPGSNGGTSIAGPIVSGQDYREAVNENWMYMGNDEWTISRETYSDSNPCAFHLRLGGSLDRANIIYNVAVRPTFYLNSDIAYLSGEGTETNPIRIASVDELHKTEDSKPEDNSNKDNKPEEPTKPKDEIENPKTGFFIPIVALSIGVIVGVILIIKSIKNKKIFKL